MNNDVSVFLLGFGMLHSSGVLVYYGGDYGYL